MASGLVNRHILLMVVDYVAHLQITKNKNKTKLHSIDSLINNSHVDPKDYYSVHVVFETSGTLELVTL